MRSREGNGPQNPRMSPDQWQLRDAWLAEMWPVCRERSRADRMAEKAAREAIPQAVNNPPENRSADCEKAS